MLTGNGMFLTGIGDVPHGECTSSPGMHILIGNAHSLYRVIYHFYKKLEVFQGGAGVISFSLVSAFQKRCINRASISMIGRSISKIK